MLFSLPCQIAPRVEVVTISSHGKRCHLVVFEGASLLIDCVRGLEPEHFREAGYALPEEIWHTQVDNTLAAEGGRFSSAKIRIPRAFADMAKRSGRYWTEARTTWERPQDWGETLGRETYGVAGSVILQPIENTLERVEEFEPGETLQWKGLAFEVADLSVRSFHAVGFALCQQGKTVAFFGGELVDGMGYLTDAHGFEANYGGLPWSKLASTLREVAARNPQWLWPATGDAMREPAPRLMKLAARIEALAEEEKKDMVRPAPADIPGRFGRYYDHGDSVFQIANYGNVILLIDAEGLGLLIDPGPCEFENPRRREEFEADLDKFESEAGLKAVDLVLVTHIHGDHYDLWPMIQERYPGCRLAAWKPVADVIEQPESYPYPCLLPWYDVGWRQCPVNIRLSRKEPYSWRGTAIHTVHLPGHCLAHAGYWLDWRGRRILFSGDSIQTRGMVDRLQLILCNHTVPGTEEGHGQAYENALPLGITLNLGGHSSHFSACAEIYRASAQRIRQTVERLREIFGDKDPQEVFVRESLRPAAEKIRAIMRES